MDERSVRVHAGKVVLEGDLGVPPGASGVVVFAHGSGSSRHSPRNRFVAGELQRGRPGHAAVDLLTADEEAVDAGPATCASTSGCSPSRLVGGDRLAGRDDRTPRRPAGRATSGPAPAAGRRWWPRPSGRSVVGAVVSRGGRPDLAGDALPRVRAPTLLIVGGRDTPVIGMNEAALARLERRQAAGDRPRGDAPVRGAGRSWRRWRDWPRLVRALPRADERGRGGGAPLRRAGRGESRMIRRGKVRLPSPVKADRANAEFRDGI